MEGVRIMSGGSFRFEEVKRLQKQLEKMQKDQDKFCTECAKELAARLLRKVIKRTPVGKPPKLDGPQTIKIKGASGKSRSFLTKKGFILRQYWSGYQGGTLRRGWTVGEIKRAGGNYEIEIINPTEYASYVEYGHRQKPGKYVPALGKKLKKGWVPGKFMLTMSLQELQTQASRIIEMKLADYLRWEMNA